MDITWYGHSCFRITERGNVSVVTDPYSESIGLTPPRLKGDIVTISHDSPSHNAYDNVKSYSHVLDGPGEYEIGGVFVTGIAMHYVAEDEIRYNVAFLIKYDGLSVLHLGDLAHIPNQSTIQDMGEVNVVLIPVGGANGLRASQAAEVIGMIEPHYIVPMHYALPGLAIELDPVDKFLKAMGVSKVIEDDFLRISSANLPEQPQVAVLRPQVAIE